MLLRSHENAHRTERAESHLEIPSIEVATGMDDGTGLPKRLADIAQVVGRAPPARPPDGRGPRPGRARTSRAAPPPRRQAMRETATQPRHGLKKIQEHGQAVELGARARRSARVAESGSCGAQRRL